MADLASTDVTYSITKRSKLEDGRSLVYATLTFGDGALTYPSGGIPLTKAKLGCPVTIDELVLVDGANYGYVWDYDAANLKLRIQQAPAATAHTHSVPTHTHDLFLKNADQADAANNRVNAAANKLGANTGGNLTVTGVADTSASGGIVAVAAGTSGSASSLAAAKLATLGNVAVAAQTLKIRVVGF